MALVTQANFDKNLPTGGGGGVGATGARLLRKVESALDHYEQSKYKVQGYALTPDEWTDPRPKSGQNGYIMVRIDLIHFVD